MPACRSLLSCMVLITLRTITCVPFIWMKSCAHWCRAKLLAGSNRVSKLGSVPLGASEARIHTRSCSISSVPTLPSRLACVVIIVRITTCVPFIDMKCCEHCCLARLFAEIVDIDKFCNTILYREINYALFNLPVISLLLIKFAFNYWLCVKEVWHLQGGCCLCNWNS